MMAAAAAEGKHDRQGPCWLLCSCLLMAGKTNTCNQSLRHNLVSPFLDEQGGPGWALERVVARDRVQRDGGALGI